LHLQRGDAAAALHAVKRALRANSAGALESRPLLLPAAVTIALAAGDRETADECTRELAGLAETLGTAFVAASAACAEGEVALADRDPERAIERLQSAWSTWCEINAPADAARAQVPLATAYRALDDQPNLTAQLEAAQATYKRLGMAAELALVERLLADTAPRRSTELAFMFTDIVGSTQLLSVLGNDSWEHLLSLHDRILRAQFAANEGTEIKHEGDGFFVAFPTSPAAADCAIGIQRALAAHRKEHGFAPSVRIGFHRGPATHRGGDYVGTGVNTAARIAAKAGDGEIFCSRTSITGDQAGLGESRMYELKGLSEPVEVVTIRWE
jgi:class 3 adenylate cyclase